MDIQQARYDFLTQGKIEDWQKRRQITTIRSCFLIPIICFIGIYTTLLRWNSQCDNQFDNENRALAIVEVVLSAFLSIFTASINKYYNKFWFLATFLLISLGYLAVGIADLCLGFLHNCSGNELTKDFFAIIAWPIICMFVLKSY